MTATQHDGLEFSQSAHKYPDSALGSTASPELPHCEGQSPYLDVDCHGGKQAPTGSVPKPQLGKIFELDVGVIQGKRPLHREAGP